MTHAELVERAGRWLAGSQRCNVVLVEFSTMVTNECADAIGWRRWGSVLIECKASRSDFHADKAKTFRRDPARGMGLLRYYMAPPGMLTPQEMPQQWGLLEPRGSIVRVVKKPEPFVQRNHRAETAMLVNAILRQANRQTSFFQGPVVLYRPKLDPERNGSRSPVSVVPGQEG